MTRLATPSVPFEIRSKSGDIVCQVQVEDSGAASLNSMSKAVIAAAQSGLSLAEANIPGLSIADTRMEGGDFPGAVLSRSSFRGVSFRGVNFSGANLSSCSFVDCDLTGAKFDGADMRRIHFLECNLDNAMFAGANMEEARIDGGSMRQSRLLSTNLVGANIQGINLAGASIVRANLTKCTLVQANLEGAIFLPAAVDGAILDPGTPVRTDGNYIASVPGVSGILIEALHLYTVAAAAEMVSVSFGGSPADPDRMDTLDKNIETASEMLNSLASGDMFGRHETQLQEELGQFPVAIELSIDSVIEDIAGAYDMKEEYVKNLFPEQEIRAALRKAQSIGIGDSEREAKNDLIFRLLDADSKLEALRSETVPSI